MIVPRTEIKLIVAVNRVHVIENVDTKALCIVTGWPSYYEGRAVVQAFMSDDAKSKASYKCLVAIAELWASKDGSMVVQTTEQR